MRFPQTIEHRGHKAKIYGRRPGYDYYRVAFRAGGKRVLRSYPDYQSAKAEAEKAVRDLWQGSQAGALSRVETTEAVEVRRLLSEFNRETGRSVSIIESVSAFTMAARKLGKIPLADCVDRYLATFGRIILISLHEAVEGFIAKEKLDTIAPVGKRPELSPKHHYNKSIQLRRFAGSFPNTDLVSLKKEHVEEFIHGLDSFSAKSRNHHRAALSQFFQWCAEDMDYLPKEHDLAKGLGKRESADDSAITKYTPSEFAALLRTSEGSMRVLIAIGGLAGIRTAELLRLDWSDVWRVAGHIDVTAINAKGRKRRKVEVCEALAKWLQPFRHAKTGKVWAGSELAFHREFVALCNGLKIERKPNGLRHGFASYYFAVHSDEKKTARQCGNSPDMIFQHYNDAATKDEGFAWFGVAPEPAESVAKSSTALPA